MLRVGLRRVAAVSAVTWLLSYFVGDPVMHRDCPLDCKIYVGNLGNNGNKTELERSFGYYGPLRSVWVARNPPGFAFVEFEDPRDATDAVRELDGRTLCGCRVRVELSNGEKRSRTRGAPPPWSRRPRDRDDNRRRSPPARRRAVTMPPLTILNQLVLFQHHVTADHRAPISLAGAIPTQEELQPQSKQVFLQRQEEGEVPLPGKEPQTFKVFLTLKK
ncbi:hypothetical protein F7725_017082, partial [Dissostichus mawsoni]